MEISKFLSGFLTYLKFWKILSNPNLIHVIQLFVLREFYLPNQSVAKSVSILVQLKTATKIPCFDWKYFCNFWRVLSHLPILRVPRWRSNLGHYERKINYFYEKKMNGQFLGIPNFSLRFSYFQNYRVKSWELKILSVDLANP